MLDRRAPLNPLNFCSLFDLLRPEGLIFRDCTKPLASPVFNFRRCQQEMRGQKSEVVIHSLGQGSVNYDLHSIPDMQFVFINKVSLL